MAFVTDDQLAAYLPQVERAARQLNGVARAEYDDLVQEGLISVWQALAAEREVSFAVVTGRMLNWIRFLRQENSDPYVLDPPDAVHD
jgi:DNA-directed RNA polymerase specialized sigma24 family protein